MHNTIVSPIHVIRMLHHVPARANTKKRIYPFCA